MAKLLEFKSQKEDEIAIDGHNLKSIEILPLSDSPSYNVKVKENIVKCDILDFGNEAFLLKNVLTQEECEHYISESENIGLDGMIGVTENYRNNLRVVLKNVALAEIIFNRVKEYVDNIEIVGDPHKQHIHGIASMLQGEWKPNKINPVFRLCKYSPKGHFAPHFDGHYVHSTVERSMKTIMLYLNGDFQGGSTNFIKEEQTLYQNSDGCFCAEEKNILFRIKPEPGLAVIFNHHRLHEGDAVRNGQKYILRSDIMYEKLGDTSLDPQEEMAFQLVQEAERLEAMGENLKAVEYYRKAFKMSKSVASSYGF